MYVNFYLQREYEEYINHFWARSLHRYWSCSSRTLGDDMLAARCLVLNSYLNGNRFLRTFDDQYRRRQVIDQCSLWKKRALFYCWFQYTGLKDEASETTVQNACRHISRILCSPATWNLFLSLLNQKSKSL